jgi:hypothetical protein
MMPHQTCAGNVQRHPKIERPGDERNLGKSLLEHVAAKVPRTKIGKGAKNKLKLLKWR